MNSKPTNRLTTVAGILNITPDSFSDGGLYFNNIPKIIDRVAQMIKEGASIIDIGGESTRPNSEEVAVSQELERVIPALEEIQKRFDIEISVDTRKSEVAEEALRIGADIINDVSAGRFDKRMPELVAKYNSRIIVMHSRKTPQTMQDNPYYEDVISEVRTELKAAVDVFLAAGVTKDKIILDPGIGFAKRYEDNLSLTANLSLIGFDEYPILYAASRKRFIAEALNCNARNRLYGGLAAVGVAYNRGARIFRVHDVAETIDFLRVLEEIEQKKI